MDKPKIRIEVYDNAIKTVRLWVDGEEVHDVTELNLFVGVNRPENFVRCHYWKYCRTESGKLLVLNNEIMTEKVIVSD